MMTATLPFQRSSWNIQGDTSDVIGDGTCNDDDYRFSPPALLVEFPVSTADAYDGVNS